MKCNKSEDLGALNFQIAEDTGKCDHLFFITQLAERA